MSQPKPEITNDIATKMDNIVAEFRVAAMDNDVATMDSIVRQYPDCDLSITAASIGRTALHWAIINQRDAAIRFLLDLGMSVTVPDIQNNTSYSLLRTHTIQDDNKKCIVLQSMLERYASMIFNEVCEAQSHAQTKVTKREGAHIKHSIKKMSIKLQDCFEKMKGCVHIGLIQCVGEQQKKCLSDSIQCIQRMWGEISSYFSAIHFGVILLEAGAQSEWIFNEILLWLSKAECRMPELLASMEKDLKTHADLLKKSIIHVALKKNILEAVGKVKNILLETLKDLEKEAEHLGASEEEGTPYKGFCEMMKKYAEAGHNIDALHLMSEDKQAILLGEVFKSYDRAQHTKWVVFLTDKFRQNVMAKLVRLDDVFKKSPGSFSTKEIEACRANMFQIFVILLEVQLKTKIEQTSALALNRMYKENCSDLGIVPTACCIYITVKRFEACIFKVIDKIINDNSLLLPKDNMSSPLVCANANANEKKQEIEAHADVVQREKRWKKEQEASQREIQKTMFMLFQHNKQERKSNEERKYAIEERLSLYREQMLKSLAFSNSMLVFRVILDPKKSQEIKWKDLLTLGETLDLARIEKNKCIFSLFDLGTVTFHKGHGKDKSEYANAEGIDELRVLLNRVGFDVTTFLQDIPKTSFMK
jgi:hypothetical protein